DHQTANVLVDRKRRGEDVEEVARPHIFKKGSGNAVHHARAKVPKKHGSKQRRDKVEASSGHAVEVPCDEAPEHDVNCNPNEERQHAGRASPHEIEVAKRNRHRACDKGIHPTSSLSGSRATVMNSSSSDPFPCSRGRVFGSPSSSILPF